MGLANMVFASAGTPIIEPSAGRRHQPTFMEKLARSLGLDFRRIQCWPLPAAEQRLAVDGQDQDMVVPVSDVAQLISRVSRRGSAEPGTFR